MSLGSQEVERLLVQAQATQHDPQQMLTICIEVINQLGSLEPSTELCRAYILAGFAMRSLGDFVNAQQYLQLALTAAKALDDPRMIASASLQLGIIDSQSHRFAEAIENLKLARHYYQTIGSLSGEAKVLLNVANVLILRDQPEEALIPLEEALAKFNENNDVVGSSQVLASIGMIQKQLGRLTEATEQLQQSQRLLQSLGQSQNDLLVSLNLSECYIALGDTEYADSMLKGVYDRALGMGLPLIQCRSLLLRSQMYLQSGKSDLSERTYAEAKLLSVAYGFEPQLPALMAESNWTSVRPVQQANC